MVARQQRNDWHEISASLIIAVGICVDMVIHLVADAKAIRRVVEWYNGSESMNLSRGRNLDLCTGSDNCRGNFYTTAALGTTHDVDRIDQA